jgi:hypothetical protein
VTRIRTTALLLTVLALPCLASAQIKLENAGAPDSKLPALLRSALEAAGSRVVRGDGAALAEIWLRKSLPAAAKGDKDALYPELSESEMVGVICFPGGAKDFRGQPIKSGCYTMRYELLPQDGNHLGVAPNPDFLLLAPAAADPDPSARFDFGQLVALSAQASGTNHPAAFSMLPPESGTLPKAFQNADSFVVFAGVLKLETGKSLPFSLIVKGQADQ